ncbi:MAG: AarF/UbiB family protein [Acidimicrobiales bacterium]
MSRLPPWTRSHRRLLQGGAAAGGAGMALGLAAFARSARQGARRRRQLLASAIRARDNTDPPTAPDPARATASPAPRAPEPALTPTAAPHPKSPASSAGALGRSGGRSRNLELARMTSRIGAVTASSTARQIFASASRRQAIRSQRQLASAADVAATLGSMKGVFMKIGQMASYLDAGMPADVRRSLASLQADAPPMAPALAASVIRAELGAAPEEVFAEWDPVPIAAASIGQVHRALTTDGRAVAVKVQYPGVDDAIRADLDSTAVLVGLTGRLFPGLDAESVVGELRSRIAEELDYANEARNQQAFGDRFAGHPFIGVPAVLPELSTARVLTSSLVVGARYEEVLSWSQEERDLAGEAIYRFAFGCLYRMRAFNGDPHPGNYVFHGGGRVTFLDFGLVKWFDDRDLDQLVDMVKTLVAAGDPKAFRRAVEAAGFLRPDPELSDQMVTDYFRHYYELVLAGDALTLSPSYASATLRHFFDATNPVLKRANLPPQFVVLQRINLGLYAVMAGLGATANWRRVAEEIWPWVSAPPSTELGRAEARWSATRPETRRTPGRPAPVAGTGARSGPSGAAPRPEPS